MHWLLGQAVIEHRGVFLILDLLFQLSWLTGRAVRLDSVLLKPLDQKLLVGLQNGFGGELGNSEFFHDLKDVDL